MTHLKIIRCVFFCAINGVSKEEREVYFPAYLPFRLLTNLFKGELIMFKDKEILSMLEKIDKKLSQIIIIQNRQRINAKKGDKKDV